MSMEFNPMGSTRVSRICNWSGSVCTTMRLVVQNMCQEQSWLTWSLALWTVFALVHMARSLGQTILSLASLVLATTGPRDTTLKGLSWLTQSLMWWGRRLKAVTACRLAGLWWTFETGLLTNIFSFTGLPADPLSGWWNWIWYGYSADL